jgi:iron complex outermembrane receptor protein
MNIEEMKSLLNTDDIVCVVSKGDQVLTSNLKGIRPWIKWLRENPELLEDAVVVDKVVGKAAAMLMVVAKIKTLYTPIISENALQFLSDQTIDFNYDRTVAFIKNIEKNGLCPMEQTVVDVEDAQQGYQLLLQKIAVLMSNK